MNGNAAGNTHLIQALEDWLKEHNVYIAESYQPDPTLCYLDSNEAVDFSDIDPKVEAVWNLWRTMMGCVPA